MKCEAEQRRIEAEAAEAKAEEAASLGCECVICFDDDPKVQKLKLTCYKEGSDGHVLCGACLLDWRTSSWSQGNHLVCPTCNESIPSTIATSFLGKVPKKRRKTAALTSSRAV